MVKGTVTENEDGTVRFTAVCMLCDKPCAVDRLDPVKVARWQGGEYVQDVFPELSASEREALVSGSHAECFDTAFPPDEPLPGDELPDEDTFDQRFGAAPPEEFEPGILVRFAHVKLDRPEQEGK